MSEHELRVIILERDLLRNEVSKQAKAAAELELENRYVWLCVLYVYLQT